MVRDKHGKTSKKHRKLYYVFFTIILILVSQTFSVSGVSDLEHQKSIEENLKENLSYVSSKIDEKGFALGFGEADLLKATSRLGLVAGYIHTVLRDRESLRILNKIGLAVEELSRRFEDKYLERNDKLLTSLAVLDFTILHYGLTSSDSSKNVMMKTCNLLVQEFGWSPITSCSTYLLYSAHVSVMVGGIPEKQDIERSLKEIEDKYMEFVNYTSLGRSNLAIGLQILSIALRTASASQTPLPVEVLAMWEVHLNYSLNYVREFSEELDYEEYRVFLNSFIYALETGHQTPLRKEVIKESEKIAEKLMKDWIAGGRLILQERSSYIYLLYDPSLSYSQIAEISRMNPTVKVYDLDLPILFQRLSKIDGVENREKFRDASGLAVSIVLSGKPYFKVLSDEIVPQSEIVNKLIVTNFLSSWYVTEKAEKLPSPEIRIAFSGFSYYTLMFSSIVLFVLLILYRLGKLIRVEEG